MLHSQTSHGDIFTSASFPLLRRLRCWIMSWSQFNPLEADWWEWEVVYDETDVDGVISFEAAPTRSTSNGLPVIFRSFSLPKRLLTCLVMGTHGHGPFAHTPCLSHIVLYIAHCL